MPLSPAQYNRVLATYFFGKPLYLDEPFQKQPNTRKLVEQPWQQTKAEMWDEVTDTLCNLEFIQAKAAAKMTYELVKDINSVLMEIPDNAENIRKENERQTRMDKYTRDLIACSKGEIPEIEIPETVPLWSKKEIDDEIERIKTNPTQLDSLKNFKNFLGQEAGNLQNYAHEFPHFATQQAWNYVDRGPVGNIAENGSPEIYKSLLLCSNPTHPPFYPLPQALQTLKGHTYFVDAISITPDGQRAISGSWDNTCIIWNLENGEKLALFVSNSSSNAVSCFPGGLFGVESSGKIFILKVNKELLCANISIVTIRSIWDFEMHRHLPLSADCPLCGHRFAPPASILATIDTVTKKAGLRPEQSSCLELPDEAWEDPGLLGECPKCGGEFKFNPFVAGMSSDTI